MTKQAKTFVEGAVSSLSKVPMVVIAVGGVAIYQLFLKKDAPFCRRKSPKDDITDPSHMSKGKRLMREFAQEA